MTVADDDWQAPSHSARIEVAISSLGWMIGAVMSAGAVAWVRGFRRVLTGK